MKTEQNMETTEPLLLATLDAAVVSPESFRVLELLRQAAKEIRRLRAASAWVPVSERLPEQGILVLVQVNLPGDVTFLGCARILSDSEWHIDELSESFGSGVAAWCELPAPFVPDGEAKP